MMTQTHSAALASLLLNGIALAAAPATHPFDPAKPVDLPSAKVPESPKLESIFDGKTLNGWHAIGGGKWTIKADAIQGQTGDGRYGWLIYDKPVTDFVLEFECTHGDHGNSGIQFRSHVLDDHMFGYQADFDPDNQKVGGTGGIYDEGSDTGRTWLFKPDVQAMRKLQKPMGEWNTYRIQATGDRLQTWVNGKPIADIRDHMYRSGIIALQVHSGEKPPVDVSFRNIRLADLRDGDKWKPLFNGRNLDGWHTQGTPRTWRVEKGQIIGELTDPSPYCYLATDASFDDFEFICEMKYDSDSGNSGVFFRSLFPPYCAKCKSGNTIRGDLSENAPAADFKCKHCGGAEMVPLPDRVHIYGPQAEFALKDQHNGFIYDARGAGWINVPSQVTQRKQDIYRFKDWNTLRICAKGNHVITWLNGYLITDLTDYDFPPAGHIALQLHESKQTIKVRFKNLAIRPATASTR